MTGRSYWKPAWWEKSLFNFCKYAVPENFKVVSYSEGDPDHKDEKYLIILKNQNTGQLIVLARVRGFHYIPFSQIEISNGSAKEPLHYDTNQILSELAVKQYLPVLHFLRQDDLKKIPENLSLRGITVQDKKEYATEKANVYYLNGSFQKIGFFKKMPFPYGFTTPVFDFLTPQKGALAILNNKDGRETIIAISSISSYKDFDEVTFRKFVSSITFDRDVFKPYWPEGVAEPKPKVKYSF